MERVDPQFAKNEEVAYGFMLHDVGKIGVPDSVLNKPGPLDDSGVGDHEAPSGDGRQDRSADRIFE